MNDRGIELLYNSIKLNGSRASKVRYNFGRHHYNCNITIVNHTTDLVDISSIYLDTWDKYTILFYFKKNKFTAK